jgi:F-type H+-transporting ATPase subunit delta
MRNPRLAARYAKSVLDLAIEQNQVETMLMDMQLLSAVTHQSPEFTAMLRSPIIKGDKKNAIVEAVIGNKLGVLSKAFITLLIAKGREGNLPEISDAFITQYKQLKNIRTVKLTTAAPVSDSVKDAIRNKVVASMPGMQIEMTEEVKAELIGGFILQVDDKLVDASIRRDLNDVKTQFQKNIYVAELR